MVTSREILNMTDNARRKLRIKRRRIRRQRKFDRPSRTPEELIQWLRDNDVRSVREIEKKRVDGDPIYPDFRKAFGRWSVAKEKAFPNSREQKEPSPSPEYLAKVMIQLKVWTRKEYRKLRTAHPDIIPSEYHVRKKWGTFAGLKAFARRESIVATLEDYRTLRRRLGKTPTKLDCKKADIDLSAALRHFRSKKEMDRLLDSVEDLHEKATRDN